MEWYIEKSGKKREGVSLKCKSCGKKFVTRKDRPSKTCSKKCAGERKQIRSEIICSWCNRSFTSVASKQKKSRSGLRFCSRTCKDKAQKIGGMKEIMPPHYGTSQGKEVYRNLIKETPDASCVGCEEKRKYLLSVHHIDGNHDNNDIVNLEIVCANCHVIRHLKIVNNEWVYSTKSLTSRDLLEMFRA